MSNFDTTANPVATSEAGDATALGVAAAATAIRNGEMSSENYATALLRQVGRREDDDDSFSACKRETAVLQRCAHAFERFLDLAVLQANDGERGQAVGQMHFHGARRGGKAVYGAGVDGGEAHDRGAGEVQGCVSAQSSRRV